MPPREEVPPSRLWAWVAIPVALMATRNDRGVLVWVVLLTFTDIGIVRSAVNVPALTIAGLVAATASISSCRWACTW